MNFGFKLPDLFNRPAAKPEPQPDARALRAESEALANAVATFLSKTGLFDREYYTRAYQDVAKSGLDPLHHYVRLGIHAGRSFTSQETIARLWREVLRGEDYKAALANSHSAPAVNDAGRFRVGVYVSSKGNFFMNEIAALVAAGLEEAGAEARVLDETTSPDADLTHAIVVAPHEFFVLGEGRRWATDDFVSRAVIFSTEQMQTQWFARSLPFLLRARLVADLNLQSTSILHRAGLKSVCVQPGYSERFRPFAAPNDMSGHVVFAGYPPSVRNHDVGKPRFADRPLDVAFMGSSSSRRDTLLASYAPTFAKLQSFIYCTQTNAPLSPQENPPASTDVTAAILARSKILLNVHRDEYAYFEWWRIMQAFWLKTVVVSEPCFPHPLFKPGVHFFEEAPRHIADLVYWLATTPEGQAKAEEVRARAYETLVGEANAKSAALRLLAAMGAA
ncbi:MAG: hypothetical protein GC190_19100 [Alphaproteobacteria bacterium]|nr:hypothetical protein [Alphaproteobacteria bacterium]